MTFNNQEYTPNKNVISGDGILNGVDLEEAQIFVEGVEIEYSDLNPKSIKGHNIGYTSGTGNIRLESYAEDKRPLPITETYNITKIIYDGVTYLPRS